jgi:integrase
VIRYHKHTRQYYVWDGVARRRVYLGTDPDVAAERFARMARPEPPAPPAGGLSVAELLAAYLDHRVAERADPRDVAALGAAARFANLECGATPAAAFRARMLQTVRTRMLAATDRRTEGGRPLSRRYVNKLVKQLVAAWTWAASGELVPAETALSLRTVRAVRLGKGGREIPRVPAVEPWAVEATLPHLHPTVRAMVELQLLAGLRPGELCALRRRDVSTDPRELVPLPGTGRSIAALKCGQTAVWLAVPGSHKTLGRGKPRAACLGPQAQAVVRPLLDRPPAALLFSPAKAPGKSFTTQSYGKCVAAAVWRANRGRCRADPPEPMVPDWRPNQLRHRAATEASEATDRSHAAAFLGHAGVDVIDVYLEQELRKAATVAAKIG